MADIGKISRARMEAYADQARRLGNVSGDLSPAQIESTLSGVNIALQEKTVTPTEQIQDVTPDSGYYGLSRVRVKGANPGDMPANSKVCYTGEARTKNDFILLIGNTSYAGEAQ